LARSAFSASFWRTLVGAYPLAMAFALVYSGEHYVVDVLLGWIYAVVAFCGMRRAFARWARRRRRVPEPRSGPSPAANL